MLGKCRVVGCVCPLFMDELGEPEMEAAVMLATEVAVDLASAGRRYPILIRQDYKLVLVVGTFQFIFGSWKAYLQIKERGYRPRR